jgi:hypothetical protein
MGSAGAALESGTVEERGGAERGHKREGVRLPASLELSLFSSHATVDDEGADGDGV